MANLTIVDSHCHAALGWYEPIESLLFEMDRNDVAKAILIQIQGQSDNSYQTVCVRRYPHRLASVVIVDTDRPDAVETLEKLAEEGASGIRLRPTVRSIGADPLAIWRAAERLGLSVSCGGTGGDFASAEFADLIQAVSSLKIVIEHLGSANRPDPTETMELQRKVFALSRFPNVHIKIHGLGEFAQRAMPVVEPFPFVQPVPSALEMAYEAFGARRMMWGSDYPPVSGREGYRNALGFTMERFSRVSDEERQQIFGGTALAVFPLRG